MGGGLRRGPRALAVGGLAGALWLGGCSVSQEVEGAEPATGPNLLVLMLDTASAKHFGAYGYEAATTPNLDAFARDATVYERASSTSNWTLPSHASIFTGLYPSRHGATGSDGWLADKYPTLAEVLGAAGYDTYLFSANPFVSEEHNLAQGFEITEYTWSPRWRGAVDAYMEGRDYEGDERRSRFVPFKDAGVVIGQAFLDWEGERDPNRPFFAFLNFMEVHRPWYVTREELSRFLDEPLVDLAFEMDHGYASRHAHSFGFESYGSTELKALAGIYDASIRHLDDVVGSLLDRLRERGRFEDTVIVVVSDHGDATGQNGRLGHEYSLYDTLLHVPLMIRHPDGFGPARVAAPVQSVDLYPTLLELAGVDAPVGHPVEGRSLRDVDPERAANRPIVGEYLVPKTKPLEAVARRHPDLDRSPWLRPLRSIELGGEKLILPEEGDPLFFDLESDPQEVEDLARVRPGRVRALRERLDAWTDAPDAVGRARRPIVPDTKHQELLEALGYAEPSHESPTAP
ncbi:sulfatase [Myxococcota bacterium]|nr:sulfatase [Myxococcota bacterium]